MSEASWRRVEELFHAALERPALARGPFLDDACGDDRGLRAEVESLLGSDDEEFLTPPSPDTLGELLEEAAESLVPGIRIGPYRVLRRIARGGMGTVVEATRADAAYEQTVAIKVLRAGSTDASSAERLRVERQLLARLTHPHIARLLDGGTTKGGRPYLVMELIDGEPIDVWCREQRLSVGARLDLVRQVALAVHHAHRQLVVHRDLKPGNIFVDRNGAPKLLDFGIAKVLGQEPTSGAPTGLTVDGVRPMTPEYASPEQVLGEPVTTATDVHALGVLLYELLTGRHPFAQHLTTRQALEQAIVEEQPERPSGVVTSAAPPGVGSGRRLRRQLRGDVDTIVLTALRKDPERRYASAEQLAEDIRRHRAGLPIVARPDRLAYRASKFARRHPVGLLACATLLLALVGGATGILLTSRVAEERLAQVLRLSDLTRLDDYRAEADALWPAEPGRTAALRDWLERARALAARLPLHRAAQVALRDRCLPYDEAAVRRDREGHPDHAQLVTLVDQRDAVVRRLQAMDIEPERKQAALAELDERSATLEAAVGQRRSWDFAELGDRWQHDKLGELIARLEDFADPQTGPITDVERRLAFAESVVRRSLAEPAAAWEQARASIADRAQCPAYDGLVLAPQLGLVPLGQDPTSGLWEFGHLQTGELARRDASGRLLVTGQTGIVFVLIPGGSFSMGAVPPFEGEPLDAANIDPDALPDEAPVHRVTLAPYLLARHELSQGQWLAATGSNPSFYQPGQLHGRHIVDLTHPVEHVSWDDCQRVLTRLGLMLPTEAQWEHAARAGTTTPWWTGRERESLRGAVNMADLSAQRIGSSWPGIGSWPDLDDGYVVHAPVDTLRPNPFGLHHVHGNVWEWCRDPFGSYGAPVRAGDGLRLVEPGDRRIGRGSAYLDALRSTTSSHRGSAAPASRDKSIGVRAARAIQPPG